MTAPLGTAAGVVAGAAAGVAAGGEVEDVVDIAEKTF